MALTGTDRGANFHGTAATSFTLQPNANFAAGSMAVLCLSVDNAGAGGGAFSTFTVTDALGNTWTRRTSPLYDPGAASAGVEGAIFTTPMDGGTLQATTVITVTFNNSTTAKVWTLMEVVPSVGTVGFVDGGVNTGAATGTPTVTTNSIANGNMVIGCGHAENTDSWAGDADTTDGSWSTHQHTGVGTGTSAQSITSQRKVVTAAATQTYNPTRTSSDCILSWIQLTEVTVTEGAGSSAGTSTAVAVGVALLLAVGSATGIATATAVGESTAVSVGSTAGAATATAVGESTATGVGSAAGTSTATGASPSGSSRSSTFDGSENPLSEGGNWATGLGTLGSLQKVAGVIRVATLSLDSNARWVGDTWNGDHSSEITLSAVFVSGTYFAGGPAVRIQSDGSCYFFVADSTTVIKVWKYVNTGAVFTQLGANITGTFAAGDVLRLEVSGSTLTIKQNGNSLGTRTDSTHTGGAAGIFGYSDLANQDLFTSWAGDGVQSTSGVGSAAGTSTATAVGQATATGVGSSAGTSTATAVSGGGESGAGTAAGTSTATAVGASIAAGTGTAAGTSLVTSTLTGIFPLSISGNGRYLVDATGKPFPMVFRASWAMMSRTLAEIKTYLDDCVTRGFTGIEWHISHLASTENNPPFCGNGAAPWDLQIGGGAYTTVITQTPDMSDLNESYWSFVDSVMDECSSRGLAMLLYGCYVGFDANSNEQGWMTEMVANGTTRMFNFGAALATRYNGSTRGKNVIWMIGGDMGTGTHLFTQGEIDVLDAYVDGLESIARSSSLTSAEWDSPSIVSDQTTFGPRCNLEGAYNWGTGGFAPVSHESRLAYAHTTSIGPALALEIPYDEEWSGTQGGTAGTGFNPNASHPIRKFYWWGWLNTIGGICFGNGYVWGFKNSPDYTAHLNTVGTQDITRMAKFMRRIPWWSLVPQGLGGSSTIITAGGGASDSATDYVAAARTSDGKKIVIYIPPAHTGSVTVDRTLMAGTFVARWWDPTNDTYTLIGTTHPNTTTEAFTPSGNNAAGEADWVLLLETETSGTGSAAGTSTATAVGTSLISGAGAAAGTATATAIGTSTVAATGAAAGTGAAAAVGASLVAGVGSAAGTSTATAASPSSAGMGTSTGTSTATAVGAAIVAGTGTAAGTSTAVGQAIAPPIDVEIIVMHEAAHGSIVMEAAHGSVIH